MRECRVCFVPVDGVDRAARCAPMFVRRVGSLREYTARRPASAMMQPKGPGEHAPPESMRVFSGGPGGLEPVKHILKLLVETPKLVIC